jgi:hypothetical protein
MGFEVILPFLRPISGFIQDPAVSEIMVNAGGRVFIERDGLVQVVDGVMLAERSLQVAVRTIARMLGDDVSEEQPILDARLPDGSRVAAVLPPCSLSGTTLTIRKFQHRFFTGAELVDRGTLTRGVLRAVQEAIEARQNILISGGTSTGKTTLLMRSRRCCRQTSASSSSKIRPNCRSMWTTSCGLRPDARNAICRPSRFATCSAPRSVFGRIGSSWGKFGAGRPTTSCRR